MKNILPKILIPALCVMPMLSHAQNDTVRLSNESKLSIKGKSNVNEFRCQAEHDLQQDSLNYSYQVEADTVTVNGVLLALEIDQFDCGKRAINRDFRSTLKYKEYPFIEIILNELVLDEATGIVPQEAKVTIRIAGVERKYTVPLNTFSSSEEDFTVGGNKVLYMTDFGLTPPSPMLGLIKVEDELDIEFDLVIRRQP
ncbi:MAG: YceI family protein [Gracilimonas sp.]|uniref:YceI family protein n=1 Tax=Gracilimonas sp. TaxID=1974203 RepID=UPI0019CC1C68|nr:YceI family protein [Gracilimonas sp.]MBD3616095.1 YceI family protein [Gracilimonas sp.]